MRDGGLIGYAMLHSATLRDALKRLVRYGRIMGDHNRIEFEEAGLAATITFEGHPVLEAIHALTELDVAWIVSGVREITTRDIVPREAPHTAIVLKRDDLAVAASDPTAFHRAFRRWPGMSPRRFRETAHQASSGPSPA